ncbi:M56 family metallopeptidase [Isosphaeraceae bacterium EP7]
MQELVDRLGSFLLISLLSAAILLSMVIVAMICCRQPSRRRAIARAGIVAALSLPPLAAFCPSLSFSIKPAAAGLATTFLSSIHADTRLDVTRTLVHSFFERRIANPWISNLTRGLTLGYLIAAIAAVGSLVLGFWALGFVIRRSNSPSDETSRVYRSLKGETAENAPDLRVSSRLRRPVLAGILRPTILIPSEMDRVADVSRLRLSLLHELAHARTHDTLFASLAAAARGLYFPLPQVWWISAQLRLDQELLADRRASVDFGGSLDYGSSLLGLAEALAGQSARESVGPASTTLSPASRTKGSQQPESSPLAPRLLMLIRAPFPVELVPPRWWRRTLVIVACLMTVLASRFTLEDVRMPLDGSYDSTLQVFTASRLEIPGGSGYPGQGQPRYDLPLVLPGNFRLSARIFASDQDLKKIELLGHRLSTPPPVPNLIEPKESPSWRDVRLKRDGAQIALWVDEQSVPADGRDTTERLSILPSEDESLLIEDLWVHW